MKAELTINGGPNPATAYIGWAPVGAQLRLIESATQRPVNVVVRNKTPRSGGQVQFSKNVAQAFSSSLTLSFPRKVCP